MTANPSGWRPEMGDAEAAKPATYTGNRALMLEEPLIFEIGGSETTGVDIDQILPGTGRGTAGEAGGGGGAPQAPRQAENPLHQPSAGPPPRAG